MLGSRAKRQLRRLHESGSGWSVIEILVVVAAMGIVFSILIPRYMCHAKNARYAAAVQELSYARDKIELFEMEYGTFPPDLLSVFDPETMPTTLSYCTDSLDANKGHGNEACLFYDSDNPSNGGGGPNSNGGTDMGYLLKTKGTLAPCSENGELFTYVHCCGREADVGDEGTKLGHPGQDSGLE